MAGTVLVTGGSGYIAGETIRQLLARGWSVHTTVRSLSREAELRREVEELRRRLGEAQETLRAIRAEAEVQVARLDYGAALDRLTAAQNLVRRSPNGAGQDHIEASIIDTRLRLAESRLREQALER